VRKTLYQTSWVPGPSGAGVRPPCFLLYEHSWNYPVPAMERGRSSVHKNGKKLKSGWPLGDKRYGVDGGSGSGANAKILWKNSGGSVTELPTGHPQLYG